MDYFAHGIWGYIFFHRTKKPLYAILFSLIPDTFSWGIYMFYSLFFTGLRFGKPDLALIPNWVFTLYGLSHSLIISGIIITLVYLIIKKVPVYMFAWPISILLDIFSHSREFLPTPFLWPISDWKFPGISWGTREFILINYTLILVCILVIIIYQMIFKKKANLS